MESIQVTTSSLELLEVVLVTDADDRSYDGFVPPDDLSVQRVEVPPGLSMGELNRRGYEASSGDYVMLLNDDVVLRTPGWDGEVRSCLRSISDGIVLLHVNDHLFEHRLCTFPLLSRTFCELAGGICPAGYRRYRIDDHIYNVFNLLSVLGRNRLIYLPDVVFEHRNFIRGADGAIEYQPDEAVHTLDTALFDELLPARKELAVKIAEHIDAWRLQNTGGQRAALLEPISDSVSLRKPEFVRFRGRGRRPSSETTRVSIGVVSADIRSPHAQACLAALKCHTKNYDLLILDNNYGPGFNHAREMNRLIKTCHTEFLVLLDDDVIVEAGWLDGLLRCVTPEVGVVTPLHKTADGVLSYAGVVMAPDYSGNHSHAFKVEDDAFSVQTICSAMMLIDMEKCGNALLDESYSKYFMDIDYGLRIWERDQQVVCSPFTLVTHLGGATLPQGSDRSNELFEEQRQRFLASWMVTGRYFALMQSAIWTGDPRISELLQVPDQLRALMQGPPAEKATGFLKRFEDFFYDLRWYPALRQWVEREIRDHVDDSDLPTTQLTSGRALGAFAGRPLLLEEQLRGLSIVLWNGTYFAFDPSEGPFIPSRVEANGYEKMYRSPRLDILKALVHSDVPAGRLVGSVQGPPTGGSIRGAESDPVLVEEGFRGCNIVEWNGLFYAVAQGDGPFVPEQAAADKYRFKAKEVSILKANVASSTPIWSRSHGRWTTHAVVGAVREPRKVLGFTRQKVLTARRRAARYRREASARISDKPPPAVLSQRAAESDSRRWATLNPRVQVLDDYRGYRIYRHEFKYFAALLADADDGKAWGPANYRTCPTGHSLTDVKQKVDAILGSGPERSLIIDATTPRRLSKLVREFGASASVLGTEAGASVYGNVPIITVPADDLLSWTETVLRGDASPLACSVRPRFDVVVLPWHLPEIWQSNSAEAIAGLLADEVIIARSSGGLRGYRGEDRHRLVYNKAYLASMLKKIPSLSGRDVLEVGCSDGMVCDMILDLKPRFVAGVDVMDTVGCTYEDTKMAFGTMDATHLGFKDASFDVVYSIATLEHVPRPWGTLKEILRVLKVGGYGYVQAGPLYHSPFGHHMFGYFDEFPWIHLRKSPEEIGALAKENGTGAKIEGDFGITLEAYLGEMLNFDHVNGLLLSDYRLSDFCASKDVKILACDVSHEGETLLTPDVREELSSFDRDLLIEHGFELVFQRIG